jgi:hypothetical protein
MAYVSTGSHHNRRLNLVAQKWNDNKSCNGHIAAPKQLLHCSNVVSAFEQVRLK